MFNQLKEICSRPEPFQYYTAADLWTDEHTSKQMLQFHLNESVDLSSRKISFIEKSVGWIADHFGVKPGMNIADFGCGPGLYSSRLAQLGADVTGIDFSTRSIEYAKGVAAENGLAIDYVNTNYLDFETDKKFDLILMIFCDFCALSPEQRKTMSNKFYRMLNSGGSVLLDVYSIKGFDQREESIQFEPNQLNGFWSPETYYGFVNTFKYDTEKVILDKYTIIEESRTRTVYNWLQHFTVDSIGQELEEANLKIVDFFSDVAGSPMSAESNEFAVIAQK